MSRSVYWLLVLFLVCGGLSSELAVTQSHLEFAAEEDFSFDRQDESFKASVSRKRSARERKTARPPILIGFARSPDLLIASRHFLLSSAAPRHQQPLHQLHKIFLI